MEVGATTEPPLSPHPSAGTAGTTGSTETGCREELGARWSPGRDHHWVPGHCRAALYEAMENTAGSSSSKGAGVVPVAFFN